MSNNCISSSSKWANKSNETCWKWMKLLPLCDDEDDEDEQEDDDISISSDI